MISISFKIIPISNDLSVNRDAYDMWYHLGDQLATILLYHSLPIFSSVIVIVAGRIKSKWNKNDNNAMIITIATIIQMIYNSPPASPKLHHAFPGRPMFLVWAGQLLFIILFHYTKYYIWSRDSLRKQYLFSD